MASRPQLQELLEEILGSESVYYQPPPSVQMDYPAIVYALSGIENTFAGDEVYAQARAYELTVIDYDPDSDVAVKISQLKTCRFNRSFQSDNLNHYVFTIYF